MTPTQALGWALIHFLWQGALVALLVRAALALIPARTPGLRYAVAVAGLAVMPVVVGVTMARNVGGAEARGPAHLINAPSMEGPSGTSSPTLGPSRSDVPTSAISPASQTGLDASTASLRARIDQLTPLFVTVWSIGVLLLAIRLLGGLVATRRLIREQVEPVSDATRAVLARLSAQLGVRRAVTVLSSGIARVPAVVGWLKPVILVPASALTGLTPAQLEIVLAHELAHIRRHDYLVNLVQSVIETLLFYHPGVWWIGGRIREEREHCCDDLAVRVAGNPMAYAEALLSLEGLRAPAAPALAATGGSLLSRVERLLGARPRREMLPRWVAGAIAVGVLALGFGGARLTATNDDPSRSSVIGPLSSDGKRKKPAPDSSVFSAQDQREAAPDTVIVAPNAGASLAERIEWARRDAARRNARGFWVGWTIEPLASLRGGFLMGRFNRVGGMMFENARIDNDVTITGRSFGQISSIGSLNGFRLPGPALAPLVGAQGDAVAVLYLYEPRLGSPRLVRVHAATASLPVHFEGRSLYWLGTADDDASLREARTRFRAASGELREDLVGMIGVHANSPVTVGVLNNILHDDDRTEVRVNAAEWLGRHATREALAALASTARTDRVADLRHEAAEAVGDVGLREALDTLIALARDLRDIDARREAVEAIGERSERDAVAALVDIANRDLSDDIRREAVESLGDLPDRLGADALITLARSHPDAEVRREAAETIAETLEPAAAVEALRRMAREDRHADVQREAIESLGDIPGRLGLDAIIEAARSAALADLRREAIETFGHVAPPADVLAFLRDRAWNDQDADVQREAVESMGDADEAADVVAELDRIARTHPSLDVRLEAVETLGDRNHKQPRALDALIGLLRADLQDDIMREVLETLGDLDDPRAREALRSIRPPRTSRDKP